MNTMGDLVETWDRPEEALAHRDGYQAAAVASGHDNLLFFVKPIRLSGSRSMLTHGIYRSDLAKMKRWAFTKAEDVPPAEVLQALCEVLTKEWGGCTFWVTKGQRGRISWHADVPGHRGMITSPSAEELEDAVRLRYNG